VTDDPHLRVVEAIAAEDKAVRAFYRAARKLGRTRRAVADARKELKARTRA